MAGEDKDKHRKDRVSRAGCPSKDSPWPRKQGKEPGRPDAT